MGYLVALSRPTACVTGAGAGVDSVWEQEKLVASLPWRAVQGKMLALGAAESPPSSAHFVGQCLMRQYHFMAKKLLIKQLMGVQDFFAAIQDETTIHLYL